MDEVYTIGVPPLGVPAESDTAIHQSGASNGSMIADLVRGANRPLRILMPVVSNRITHSSSVLVAVLFTTAPLPKAGWVTMSPSWNLLAPCLAVVPTARLGAHAPPPTSN